MTLYDWLLTNGIHVDYWHAALSVGGWFHNDSAERYSLGWLGPDHPAAIERKLNGVVLPFEVLFALRDIELPVELYDQDFSQMCQDVMAGKYFNPSPNLESEDAK